VKNKILTYIALLTLFTGVVMAPVNSYGAEVTESTEKETSDLVAGDDEKAPAQEVGTEDMVPVYGKDIADGTYSIEVESSSSMFCIEKAELTVADGSMSAVITLGGKGYLRLFMGTGEEAVAADESAYAEYKEDAEGAYTYEIAVEALNKELECTGFSKRKEKWYDHQICFDAATLPAEALLIELPTESTSDEEAENENTETDGTDGAESVAGTENAAEADESQSGETETSAELYLEQAEIDLADGTYQINVDMAGGSGKATIESPATLKVSEKKATAVIVWSSPNYDYMIVNGEKYLPVNTEGNSTFEIPVLLFDGEMPVKADTVAMGTPHEIEYTLTFHSDSMEEEDGGMMGIAAVAAVLLLCVGSLVLVRKRKSVK